VIGEAGRGRRTGRVSGRMRERLDGKDEGDMAGMAVVRLR
jgi:hypothetical protein